MMSADRHTQFNALFNPRGVVVAGASSHPGKFGFTALHNVRAHGFAGPVFAINRDGETILGEPTYRTVGDIPSGVADLVIVCTPAKSNQEILRSCAEKGIRAAFVASAGYREADEAGAMAERELAELAEELGILLAGPNGQGLISTPAKLCAQIVAPYPVRGRISIASQSGNLCSAFMNIANASGAGIARAVSVGNAAATTVSDFAEYFADDPETAVVLAYLESVSDGRTFLDQLRAVSQRKPVVLLKGGSTEAGQSAAASHTGALASADRVLDGALRQVGVRRARTVAEAYDAAAAFATQPLPRGPRVAVLTTVGGWGVLSADAIANSSLELATLPTDLYEQIDAKLPPRWSKSNPIDMAGGETRDTIPELLDIVASHDAIDAVLFLGLGVQSNTAKLLRSGPFFPDHGLERIVEFHERQDARFADAAVAVSRSTGKPVLIASELGISDPMNPGPRSLRDAGHVCFPSADRAVAALDHMWSYVAWKLKNEADPSIAPTASQTPKESL
jgi:acyl-CoA synthetase (NDP forming)